MGLTSYNKRRRILAERQKLKEPVKPQEKYTYNSLESLNRSEQSVICEKLGLGKCWTMREEDRINLILKNM